MTDRHLSRVIAPAVLACLLCATAGCSTVGAKLRPKWLAPADERIAMQLQRRIRVGLAGQPLHRTLEWLRLTTGENVRFHINWPALRDAGATPQTPIQLRIERTTIGEALHDVLEIASAADAQDPIEYRIAGGLVLISTRKDLYQSINVRAVYNVRDIIVSLSDYRDLPGYRPDDAAGTAAATAAGAARQAAVGHIIQIIQDTVGSSQDWTAGSIHEINGDLIVVTTPNNQEQIEALLKDLRKSRKQGRKNLRKERRGGWFSGWFG